MRSIEEYREAKLAPSDPPLPPEFDSLVSGIDAEIDQMVRIFQMQVASFLGNAVPAATPTWQKVKDWWGNIWGRPPQDVVDQIHRSYRRNEVSLEFDASVDHEALEELGEILAETIRSEYVTAAIKRYFDYFADRLKKAMKRNIMRTYYVAHRHLEREIRDELTAKFQAAPPKQAPSKPQETPPEAPSQAPEVEPEKTPPESPSPATEPTVAPDDDSTPIFRPRGPRKRSIPKSKVEPEPAAEPATPEPTPSAEVPPTPAEPTPESPKPKLKPKPSPATKEEPPKDEKLPSPPLSSRFGAAKPSKEAQKLGLEGAKRRQQLTADFIEKSGSDVLKNLYRDYKETPNQVPFEEMVSNLKDTSLDRNPNLPNNLQAVTHFFDPSLWKVIAKLIEPKDNFIQEDQKDMVKSLANRAKKMVTIGNPQASEKELFAKLAKMLPKINPPWQQDQSSP